MSVILVPLIPLITSPPNTITQIMYNSVTVIHECYDRAGGMGGNSGWTGWRRRKSMRMCAGGWTGKRWRGTAMEGMWRSRGDGNWTETPRDEAGVDEHHTGGG